MTVEELAYECAARRKWYADNGVSGEPGILLAMPKPPGGGLRMRVFPGVMGEICSWNGQNTIVRVRVCDVERAIAKAKKTRGE